MFSSFHLCRPSPSPPLGHPRRCHRTLRQAPPQAIIGVGRCLESCHCSQNTFQVNGVLHRPNLKVEGGGIWGGSVRILLWLLEPVVGLVRLGGKNSLLLKVKVVLVSNVSGRVGEDILIMTEGC